MEAGRTAPTPRPTTAPTRQSRSPNHELAECADSLFQTPIDRLDKRIAGNECAGRVVQRVVVKGWFGGPYLIERHVPVDHVLHAIADDGHHFAEVDDVADVRQAAVSGNDHRAALLAVHRNAQVDDVVEPGHDALHVAAGVQIDERVAFGHEQITGANHVRLPEEHDAVAV